MSAIRFDGRVVIVTGAGRGIGRAHAAVLAARGAHVVVNDLGAELEGGGLDRSVAAGVVAEIEAAGGVALADGSDVASPDGAEALVESALERFGRLDAVVNNAGIIRWSGFPESDADELESHLAVHVVGSYNVSRAAWPQMAAQGYGRILMTTSSAIFGAPQLLSYGAAKGGVVGLARALAAQGAEHGILVNVISPLAFTRMMASAGVGAEDEVARQTPPELVSEVAAYLLHESCTDTGQIYAAGGGRVALVFLGETYGFQDHALTAEAVRDHWLEINDRSRCVVPASTLEHSRQVQELDAEVTGR
jgi:NAD(P)-dependent dehydrogenase (short-subunit alcohol dehydrogenase family)